MIEILACPICKANIVFGEEQLTCQGCGELYQCVDGIPIMLPSKINQDVKLNIKSWSDFYQGMSGSDLKKAKDDYYTRYLEDTFKYLERYWDINKIKNEAIYFEVGCGPAFLGLEMAKRGYRVVGLDICIEALKVAKKVYEEEGQNAFFVCGDILQMPFKEGVFDFIYGEVCVIK